MTRYLFDPDSLPDGFKFPKSFLEYVAGEPIPYLKPWWFLCEFKDSADFWLSEIKRQYPQRALVPFAKLNSSDDVVCFDASEPSEDPRVFYVHTFASAGWEDRGHLSIFAEWLEAAERDHAQFKSETND